MVATEDMLLTKDEMRAKYADKGSPDYPSHPHGCPCSGCYASWVEWRGAHAVVEVLQVRKLREAAEDMREHMLSAHKPPQCMSCAIRVKGLSEALGSVTPLRTFDPDRRKHIAKAAEDRAASLEKALHGLTSAVQREWALIPANASRGQALLEVMAAMDAARALLGIPAPDRQE